MANNLYELTGIVQKSDTKIRGCGGLITELIISPELELGVYVRSPDEKPKMNIAGRHMIRVGEKLRIKYNIHSSVYWADSYDVLDECGNVLHSDVSDDRK